MGVSSEKLIGLFGILLHCFFQFSLLCASPISSREYLPLRVIATRTGTPPLIDGKLDDACWVESALARRKDSGFVTNDGESLAGEQTIFYLVYDEQSLYVAIVNFAQSVDGLRATAKNHDDASFIGASADDAYLHFNNDENKMFININPFQISKYFLFDVNWIGVQAEAKVEDGRIDMLWDIKWHVKTSKETAAWQVEISIPFKGLGTSEPELGSIWGFNLARAHTAIEKWSVWSCSYGPLHQPESFGYIVFGEYRDLHTDYYFKRIIIELRVSNFRIKELKEKIDALNTYDLPSNLISKTEEIFNKVNHLVSLVREIESEIEVRILNQEISEAEQEIEKLKTEILKHSFFRVGK